jgi:aspartate/methionine/tyrosine aminotransferase
MTVLFEQGVLRKGQFLKPANKMAEEIIKPLVVSSGFDKCFVYHLLASRGICVVPLSSGFNSDLQGFRITLLEPDIGRFKTTMNSIAEAAREYMGSQ